jgi:hypothetical protein
LNKSKEERTPKSVVKEEVKEGEGEGNDDSKKEPEFKEAEIEDRVMLINPNGDNFNILVSHQAVGRVLRNDLLS